MFATSTFPSPSSVGRAWVASSPLGAARRPGAAGSRGLRERERGAFRIFPGAFGWCVGRPFPVKLVSSSPAWWGWMFQENWGNQ